MSASVSDDMIRSYFDRWQRLEEEKRTISDDLKELFAEAKGNGLEAKALRTVFREQVGDKNALQEFDAICDLYRASLNAPRAGRARESQSYAEAKGRESVEARQQFIDQSGGIGAALSAVLGVEVEMVHADPETGELTDTQEQPEEPATQSEKAASAVISPNEYAGTSSDENPAPIPNPQPAASLGNADKAPEAGTPPPASGAALSEAEIPTFLRSEQRKTMADYRPNCLHPDTCAATGLTHCYVCRKAMEAASETEAA